MDRIEKVREYVDKILMEITDSDERRCAYIHLYGVSQACSMLALKRNEKVELAAIAGMLHDISAYAAGTACEHALKSAVMAKEILNTLQLFTIDEIEIICHAISYHSQKELTHSSFDEVLIDADVLQHYLYNPLLSIKGQEQVRYEHLRLELDL